MASTPVKIKQEAINAVETGLSNRFDEKSPVVPEFFVEKFEKITRQNWIDIIEVLRDFGASSFSDLRKNLGTMTPEIKQEALLNKTEESENKPTRYNDKLKTKWNRAQILIKQESIERHLKEETLIKREVTSESNDVLRECRNSLEIEISKNMIVYICLSDK